MAASSTVLEGEVGKPYFLLGNEAIARGAIEADVQVMACYPGAPLSEIGDTLVEIARKTGMYMEYSTNEIVALEVAAGAAVCGARGLAAMKTVGLNIASDALMTLAYTGVRGGLIVLTADDPYAHDSQNQQDNRYYALLSNLPGLEPSNPQETKDMLVYGFRLSEELELPVILRLANRICFTRSQVVLGSIEKKQAKPEFVKDFRKFVMVPDNARVRHLVLLEKMDFAEEASEESPFNKVYDSGRIGIITSGVSFNYCREALEKLGLEASTLKIGMFNPLPRKLISDFLKAHEPIIIVEESEPYLELQVKGIAKDFAPDAEILGKSDEYFPRHGEFSTRIAAMGFSKIFNKLLPRELAKPDERAQDAERALPPKTRTLCAGCPHMASLYAIRVAGGAKTICVTDIGCYSLGAASPLSVGDILMCAGASSGVSCGVSETIDNPVMGVVGDSTFFRASIPGLINAVYNNHKFVYVVLDNLTAAMTGFQPDPGTGVTALGKATRRVVIEEVVKACGVEFVKVVDPYDVKTTISTLKEAAEYPGVSVVVCRRICSALDLQRKRRSGEKVIPYFVDEKKCDGCQVCLKLLGCPSLTPKAGKVTIDRISCFGCGVCAQVCPCQAISSSG